MKSILIPIDGSASSLNALRAALATAHDQTALHVITVHPPIASGNVRRFIAADVLQEYYQEEGEKALAVARPVLQQAGVTATIECLVGPIAETIAQYVREHGCDHVFMGTRGLGNVSSLLLGSVTTKVLSLVDVPVTLVK